jgi:hypothetical protein
MIKIIKEGTRTITTCNECGCKFSYEEEDIKTFAKPYSNSNDMAVGSFITCPQCSNDIILNQTR